MQTQTQDAGAVTGSTGAGGSVDTNTVSGGNRSNAGFTEGIPGPVTRLIVLGNRGLANLIQDLILVSVDRKVLARKVGQRMPLTLGFLCVSP